MKAEQLAKASKDLMLKEPFYGLFLIMLNKQWTGKVPTAAVSLNGINYQLLLNEKYWDTLSPEKRQGLLKHELLHIGFFHLTDFKHLTEHKIANIAMDLVINQFISDDMLPEGGMKLEMFPELKLEANKSTDYYYEKLLQASNKGNCSNLNDLLEAMKNGDVTVTIAGKDCNVPDHGTWEEMEKLPEAAQKLIQKQVEHILKEISDQVQKSRGTIPGEFAEILERINHVEPPKFDWKGYLRRFSGGSVKTFTKKTRRKYNKRYDENPGLKIKHKNHILVAIDTSGSVSTNELKEFMGEIHHIHKSGTDVTIAQADTAISHIGEFNPKKELKVHGRGGTDFQPIIDYFNENVHKYTSLIYFTDGEAPAPSPAKGRVLWVISSSSNINEDLIGAQIKLN